LGESQGGHLGFDDLSGNGCKEDGEVALDEGGRREEFWKQGEIK
jgi:hypothetical protein